MNDNSNQNTLEPKKEQVENELTSSHNPATNQDNTTDPNESPDWRAVREQRKADRKAREEAEKRAAEKARELEAYKAALEAMANKPSPLFNTGYQEDESEEARLDRLVEAKMQKLEQQREQQRHKKELEEAPNRIRQIYPDFDQVCSPENMDYVDYHHPELTAPYSYMPDGYAKWEAMYKATKKLLPKGDAKKEAARVERNLAKPGSISSTGTTQANQTSLPASLSEDRKAANWERMQKQLKGLS